MSETAALLADAVGTIQRYVVLANDAQHIALALWALHTWAFEGAHATPYICITSPEKRTGKSLLLEGARAARSATFSGELGERSGAVPHH